jgi:hypothetical protein
MRKWPSESLPASRERKESDGGVSLRIEISVKVKSQQSVEKL